MFAGKDEKPFGVLHLPPTLGILQKCNLTVTCSLECGYDPTVDVVIISRGLKQKSIDFTYFITDFVFSCFRRESVYEVDHICRIHAGRV